MGIETPISRSIERSPERDITLGPPVSVDPTPDGVMLSSDDSFMIFADGDNAQYTG